MTIKAWSFYILSLAILLSAIQITQLLYSDTQALFIYWGVLLDVMLFIPVLFYFLLYRNNKISKYYFYLLVYLGGVFCYYVLPANNNPLLTLQPYYQYLMLFCISCIQAYLLFLTVRLLYKLRNSRLTGEAKVRAFFYMFPILTKIKTLMKNEFLMLYYAFTKLRCSNSTLTNKQYSYHIRSGAPSLTLCLVMVIIIESPISHFIIEQFFGATVSWIKTGLSLYSALGFLGIAYAMPYKPVQLFANKLLLQTSLIWRIDIPYHNIKSINSLTWKKQENANYSRQNICFMAAPSLEIQLHQSQIIHGPFGIKRKATVIWFDLDNGADFILALRERMT